MNKLLQVCFSSLLMKENVNNVIKANCFRKVTLNGYDT